MVRWQPGTRVTVVGSVLPMLVTRPVRYGDMLAEVRYAGATGTRLVHTAFLDVR